MKIPRAEAAVFFQKDVFAVVRPKAGVVQQAQPDNVAVHFESLTDLCHLNWSELAKHLQTCRGRVVLQGDNVNDDDGHKAVFTEQGGSAVKWEAANTLSGHDLQITRYGRRTQRRSPSVHTSAQVRSSKIAKVDSERMPSSMDTTTTQSKTRTVGQHCRTRGSC